MHAPGPVPGTFVKSADSSAASSFSSGFGRGVLSSTETGAGGAGGESTRSVIRGEGSGTCRISLCDWKNKEERGRARGTVDFRRHCRFV